MPSRLPKSLPPLPLLETNRRRQRCDFFPSQPAAVIPLNPERQGSTMCDYAPPTASHRGRGCGGYRIHPHELIHNQRVQVHINKAAVLLKYMKFLYYGSQSTHQDKYSMVEITHLQVKVLHPQLKSKSIISKMCLK